MQRIWLSGRVALAVGMLIGSGATYAQNPNRSSFDPPLIVEPDNDIADALKEAQESIARKEYVNAVQLLQRVLDHPEDSFIERDFLKDQGTRGGIRKEASRILMMMPADGHAAYELAFGIAAKDQLSKAIESHDMSAVAEVSRRYAATNAGFDAGIMLAAYAFDANRPFEAAMLLEVLKNHPRRTPQFWLQQAVYWTSAGRMDRGLKALREIKRVGPQAKLRVAGKEVTLPEEEIAPKWLRSLALLKSPALESESQAWMTFGGGLNRNVSAAPTSPVGGLVWRVSTLEHLSLDGRSDEDRRIQGRIQEVRDRVHQSMATDNRSNITTAQPLVIGDTVVYRTIADVTAVSLKTGELLWRSAMVDETLQRVLNTRSIEARLRTGRGLTLASYLERRIFRDNTAGTLSSDGRLIYSLEELDGQGHFNEVQSANKLVAFDLAGGRIQWEIGGPRGTRPVEMSGQYFLGPPLPADDRLYLLSETQGVLQLLVLKHDDEGDAVQQEWSQTLIATDRSVGTHMPRRLSGLSPSISEGVVICPTASGAVVAVDEKRRELLWGFQYPTNVQPEPRDFAGFRRVTPQPPADETDRIGRSMEGPAVIADGRVLVVPRDSNQLFCLDLVDGRLLWKHEREGWLYIACVVDGKVVLVDRSGVKALQLSDGKLDASFEETTVEVSGRGVRSGMSYHLPLQTGEIATVNLHNGRILARSKFSDGLVPGNLAAGHGAIVSLSMSEIVGFASLKNIQQRIDEELKSDPEAPAALALRGELRLHRGELDAGLSDLRSSLKKKPDPRVKSVLAATLLAVARVEPARIRAHLAEFESITDDPQQKNEFLRLYSQVLEAAGDRSGAFAQMIRLAGTSQFLDDLKSVGPGHSVRNDRSIRARLIEMYSAATPVERGKLDQSLKEYLQTVPQGSERVEHLEQCLRFFKGLPGVESTLLSAARELPGDDRDEMIRSFLGSTDSAIAAQATAIRCDEFIKAGQWVEAAGLIKRLKGEFGDRECLNGKTGRDLADQWSSRPELQLVSRKKWPTGRIEFQRSPREPGQESNLPAEVISRSGSQFVGWSFDTDPRGTQLRARDEFSHEQWRLALTVDDLVDETRNMPIPCQIRICNQWLTVSRSSFFIVVDVSGSTPRVAWSQSLRNPAANQEININGPFNRYPDYSPFGRVIGVTSESVLYKIGSKLISADLDSGRLAWTRSDASTKDVMTADEQTIANSANGNVILWRTIDGSDIATRTHQSGNPIWNVGSRQILHRFRNGAMIVECRDLVMDQIVWQQECPMDTLSVVVDHQDLAILEPEGRLKMFRLTDGREVYQTELPIKSPRPRNWLVVQRSIEQDIILTGERTTQASGFEMMGSQVGTAFNGYVCAVSPTNGKVQWVITVERAAYDRTQPASLPLLMLASRQLERRNANAFEHRFRMNAEIIDKRTGRKMYSTEEDAPLQSPRFEPDPEHSRIVANFFGWQLEFALSESVAEPAKAK
ncbi:MAG: PQQ-binding-like beta-propeller repeat protein [Planctomycetota bacterium]